MLSIASSRVDIDRYAPALSSRSELPPQWLVGETFESKSPVRVHTENAFLQFGQPWRVACSNTSITRSMGNPTNLRSSDIDNVQDVTSDCCSVNIVHGSSGEVQKIS